MNQKIVSVFILGVLATAYCWPGKFARSADDAQSGMVKEEAGAGNSEAQMASTGDNNPAVPAPPGGGEAPNPDEKYIFPFLAFSLSPAPTTAAPIPGPHPQTVIIPQGSTLSVVAAQPLNIQQGPAPTSLSGPGPVVLQTGK